MSNNIGQGNINRNLYIVPVDNKKSFESKDIFLVDKKDYEEFKGINDIFKENVNNNYLNNSLVPIPNNDHDNDSDNGGWVNDSDASNENLFDELIYDNNDNNNEFQLDEEDQSDNNVFITRGITPENIPNVTPNGSNQLLRASLKKTDAEEIEKKRNESQDKVSVFLHSKRLASKRALSIKEQKTQEQVEAGFFKIKAELGLGKGSRDISYNFTYHRLKYTDKNGMKHDCDLADKKTLFHHYRSSKAFLLEGQSLSGKIDSLFGHDNFGLDVDNDKRKVNQLLEQAFDNNWSLAELNKRLEVSSFDPEVQAGIRKIFHQIEQKHAVLAKTCEDLQYLMRKRVKPRKISRLGLEGSQTPYVMTSQKLHNFLFGNDRKDPQTRDKKLSAEFVKRAWTIDDKGSILNETGINVRRKMDKARYLHYGTVNMLNRVKAKKLGQVDTEQKKEKKLALQKEIRAIDKALHQLNNVSGTALDWTLMHLEEVYTINGENKTGYQILNDGKKEELRLFAKESSKKMNALFSQESASKPWYNIFGKKKNHEVTLKEKGQIATLVGGMIYHLKPYEKNEHQLDRVKDNEVLSRGSRRLQYLDYHWSFAKGPSLAEPPLGMSFLLNSVIDPKGSYANLLGLDQVIVEVKVPDEKDKNKLVTQKISLEETLQAEVSHACGLFDQQFNQSSFVQSLSQVKRKDRVEQERKFMNMPNGKEKLEEEQGTELMELNQGSELIELSLPE